MTYDADAEVIELELERLRLQAATPRRAHQQPPSDTRDQDDHRRLARR